ncbi:MAG: sulfotransferase domain-containing protein [Candidatus Sulfotelmatobacter sp.]
MGVAPALPNFFIVGAPKAGTTSLYHYLEQHPDVYMSPVKEPNYFAEEIRLGNISAQWKDWAQREHDALQLYLRGPMHEKRFGGIVSNWSDYLKLFENVNGEKAIGEASVCYLWSKTAAQKIALTTPNAKIIMVLRNPVERAVSQYKQAVTSGLIGKSFREQVRKSLNNKSDQFELLNPFLEFGLYYEQVKRYTERFTAENLRIYLYEEYKQTTTRTLTDIFYFLRVDSQFSPDVSEKYLQASWPRFKWVSFMLKKCGVWSPLKNAIPKNLIPFVQNLVFETPQKAELDSADRAELSNYYREDVARLSDLIKRDLHTWVE